mmetsp:Transcript_52287/g.83475  ORF Transcript_52287/g.83475 Transcript_52287/m.83475 type:complete len:288 (-) Transcript_52287:255-1118(-)
MVSLTQELSTHPTSMTIAAIAIAVLPIAAAVAVAVAITGVVAIAALVAVVGVGEVGALRVGHVGVRLIITTEVSSFAKDRMPLATVGLLGARPHHGPLAQAHIAVVGNIARVVEGRRCWRRDHVSVMQGTNVVHHVHHMYGMMWRRSMCASHLFLLAAPLLFAEGPAVLPIGESCVAIVGMGFWNTSLLHALVAASDAVIQFPGVGRAHTVEVGVFAAPATMLAAKLLLRQVPLLVPVIVALVAVEAALGVVEVRVAVCGRAVTKVKDWSGGEPQEQPNEQRQHCQA